MSVTTIDNLVAVRVHRTLNDDYQIRLTGDNTGPIAPPNQTNDTGSGNPDNWPQNHRNIPPHRPINYNLDISQRENASNRVEQAFIFVMLHGVWLNATIAQTWHKTGGRINDKIFRYSVGGEW